MDPRLAPLAETLRLNTRLLRNCLDGLTDEEARRRPGPASNSAAFIAAHLVESRHYILKVAGAERPGALDRYLSGWKGIDEMTEWPTLDQVREAWTVASDAVDARLRELTPAELDAPLPTQMPLETKTVLGMLTFMVQHDSYHLGQAAWLRKWLGHPAMSYS